MTIFVIGRLLPEKQLTSKLIKFNIKKLVQFMAWRLIYHDVHRKQ